MQLANNFRECVEELPDWAVADIRDEAIRDRDEMRYREAVKELSRRDLALFIDEDDKQ